VSEGPLCCCGCALLAQLSRSSYIPMPSLRPICTLACLTPAGVERSSSSVLRSRPVIKVVRTARLNMRLKLSGSSLNCSTRPLIHCALLSL
jgi:hypothetical protein